MVRDGNDHDISAIPGDTLVLLNRATLIQHTVRTAVHELNNVLQMIAGSAELLGAAAVPPAAAARVETILKHANRGHLLLQSVSELARVTPPAVRTIDVASLCDQALQLRRYEHKRAAITAVLERPANGAALARADAPAILQAILNLIVNAEQSLAGAAGAKTITVSVGLTGDQVAVVVSDSGAGPGSDPGIFEAFVTTRGQSAGLGLTAARLIARQAGGDLRWLDGTSFQLTLPASVAAL
jgi:two-component system NtrC family sensor kinase